MLEAGKQSVADTVQCHIFLLPADAAAGPGESPQATLGRIRAFAPTAAKLAESGGEYLATIKARRQEEVAGRKEREVRWPGFSIQLSVAW
jgi:hypothetical protein